MQQQGRGEALVVVDANRFATDLKIAAYGDRVGETVLAQSLLVFSSDQ